MIDMSAGANATRGKQTLIMGSVWGGWLTAITKIDFTLRTQPLSPAWGDAPHSSALTFMGRCAKLTTRLSPIDTFKLNTAIPTRALVKYHFNSFKNRIKVINF